MKYRVLELLKDVTDGSQLELENSKIERAPCDAAVTQVMCKDFCGLRNCAVEVAGVTAATCRECYSNEIVEGELVSPSGRRYRIVGGVPRLLSESSAAWVKKNQRTFSLEWSNFRFGERNWGQTIEYRQDLFLMGMGVKAEDLAGKVILDAGCGSGALSIALAESYEMEVVAMDLAAGIEQAYAYNRNPFVYFVQGSVLEPPFRHGSVDFLYCAGVLVAIPEPKLGLRTLAPILKPGGRYFTWWYHPIDRRHHPNDLLKMATYNWIRENVTSRLTIGMQRALYMGSMPLYFLKRELENMFREQRNTTTWREKMQDLTDMFSPVYQHRYTEEEIVQWYEELRFVDASIGYQEAYGFGVRGDSPAL